MRRRLLLVTVLAVLPLLLLTGCLFKAPDELYRRPMKSAGYDQLTAAIQAVRSGLEMEFTTTCEDALIVSGDNTATIQLQDLDNDAHPESAIVFLRVPGSEKSMKIYIFTQKPGEEEYQVSAVVEGDGSAIYSVDYADLNGVGLKELVVGWQISSGVYQLGAYTLDELDQAAMNYSGNGSSSAAPDRDRLRATELLLTNCSAATGSSSSYARGYILSDIDQDTRKEIAVVRMDTSGVTSEMEVYGWREGAFLSLGRAGLSTGAVSFSRLRDNYLGSKNSTLVTPALYVTCTLDDGNQAVDVLAFQDAPQDSAQGDTPHKVLTNISLDPNTGVSRTVLPASMSIAPSLINDDMVLEMPSPRMLPTWGDSTRSNFWLIDWGQYLNTGEYRQITTTYHNSADGWYLIIPEEWNNKITISRNDSLSGQRQVDFSLWKGQEEPPETFLSIFQLTGSNRGIRASSGGRFTLREEGETIYAAKLYETQWDCGLDQEKLTEAFNLIRTAWMN